MATGFTGTFLRNRKRALLVQHRAVAALSAAGRSCGVEPMPSVSSEPSPAVAASRPLVHKFYQLRQALLDCLARCVELDLGLRVVGAACFEDCDEIGHRGAIVRHRPKIALGDDARHMFLRRRLDPDRVGAAQQQRVSFGI